MVCHPGQALATANLPNCNSTHYEDMKGDTSYKKWGNLSRKEKAFENGWISNSEGL